MSLPIDWLLEGPPWVQYRARVGLLGQAESHPDVQAARRAMIDSPEVQALLAELRGWPGTVLKGHKSAGHPLHKLVFVVELGLRADDPELAPILEQVLAHQSPEGPFQMITETAVAYGGTGKPAWTWALCDAPHLLYALTQAGLDADPRVAAAREHLVGLLRANGWPCYAGKWRGPGRKEDPCPYANLMMLQALSASPAWVESPAARTGVEAALALWDQRRQQHPYMFYMGTDFCKLKAPTLWYDILHVADVLTRFPWARDDPRLLDMLGIIRGKADAEGRFTPESVWRDWSAWDFGQKKVPSRGLTLLAWRVLGRRP